MLEHCKNLFLARVFIQISVLSNFQDLCLGHVVSGTIQLFLYRTTSFTVTGLFASSGSSDMGCTVSENISIDVLYSVVRA